MDTSERRALAPGRAEASSGGRPVRILSEPAFVLHSYPYKETSLILDALTRHHGRVALVARGAKRPRSALRGLLLAFRPLSISWMPSRSRSGELATLTAAEWVGGVAPPEGEGLLCGFYLNELLIKLLARDDSHEALFDAYLNALIALGARAPAAPVLRRFEYTLLAEAGYALQLTHCAASGLPLEPEGWYRYEPEKGPIAVASPGDAPADRPVVRGKTLLDIEAVDYSDPVTLAQSKLLSRQLLNHHLAGHLLHTRQMMLELQDL
jgi:DNA repair protein RecO (recombination protein O)